MQELPGILDELGYEYRESPSPPCLETILFRCRPVIFYAIYMIKKHRSHLHRVDNIELYNTAVLGVHKCFSTWPNGLKPEHTIGRVINYIRREIAIVFKYRPNMHVVSNHIIDATMSSKDEKMELRVEIREQMQRLIRDGVLSVEEFDMLVEHFVHGMTVEKMAATRGQTHSWISRQIREIRARAHKALLQRGWDNQC